MLRSRHRADDGHWKALAALRAFMTALDAHNYGLGFDILAKHCKTGAPVMIEYKPSKRAKLTPKELAMSVEFPEHWKRCDSLDEALAAVGAVG